MSEYRLDNGYVLTDEEIEKRAKEWEEETWEGPLVELRAGLSRLSEELEKKFNVTHGQLEAWASEYESEDWSSLKFGASTPGRPKLYAEDMDIITVKVPHSRVAAMKQAAERSGISRSEFIRRAIDHELIASA